MQQSLIQNSDQAVLKRLKLLLFILVFMVCFFLQILLSKKYSNSFIAMRSERNRSSKHHLSVPLEDDCPQELLLSNTTKFLQKFSPQNNTIGISNSTAENYGSNRSNSMSDQAPVVDSVDRSTTKTTPLCTREQIRRGHWKALQLSKPPYISSESWESTCYRKKGSREGQLEVVPFQDWEWAVDDEKDEENGCLFAPFDVDRFCQLSENRTFAFLGDSIMWQQFNSLNLLLGAKDESRSKALIKTHACNESTKLIWMRDNYATKNGLNSIIELSDPNVIIFNRGAHFTNNSVLAMGLNATLARAVEWQQDCDQRNDKRDCLLVWRTTAPGFPDCTRVPGPIGVDNRSMAEALISNQYNAWYTANSNRREFHWWDFADQNALAEHLIQHQKENLPGFQISFIDFYEMAILRPDNHIDKQDCLHWCLPGPPDAANAVLLHQMEVAAST